MKYVVLAAALLLPSPSFAAKAVEVDARSHTCAQLAQFIRQHKTVFVRVGFGGRSFRYPPAQCRPGEMWSTTRLRDASGKQCILDYACVYDPNSYYNIP
ncbi:hypothetical protein [Sinorhizobium sp. BG8]|uniref:hypothetical protein n=1 Tax=Sinorhizobium sp. BG8 TaxID=2613773 RepID=UPI00193D30E1|nr:hypothetical protein [Sinorhizobium sp. BG8]QRM53821.1 hypothetical protein F3Y30_04060 [Sinorhizobium sp. BG8]